MQYCNKFTILSVLFADSILKKDFQAVYAARHFEAMPSWNITTKILCLVLYVDSCILGLQDGIIIRSKYMSVVFIFVIMKLTLSV